MFATINKSIVDTSTKFGVYSSKILKIIRVCNSIFLCSIRNFDSRYALAFDIFLQFALLCTVQYVWYFFTCDERSEAQVKKSHSSRYFVVQYCSTVGSSLAGQDAN
jgi:hypothetical protein